MTLDELKAGVQRGKIDTVLLAMTDMQGRLQGKRLTAEHFLEEVADHGAEGCNYLLAVDVDMTPVDGYEIASWDKGYGDFAMRPDLDTLRLAPWLPATALCLADLQWAGALRTADEHSIYKNAAKEIADQEGMAISFMAKFNEREGSSCHIHFSLADESGPVFAGDRGTFDAFVAGQLACLRELTLLLAPNVNSYKRFAEGSFAPTAVAWGNDNRTCALRVVGHGPALRFENRAGGSDLNPYLALSALIAAGLHGVDNQLQLEPAFEGNAYLARDKPRLPTTLREARDLFAGSAVARAAFSDQVVDHYAHAADVELGAFEAAVTDWERFRGFERL
jgi:glutamine synthetase